MVKPLWTLSTYYVATVVLTTGVSIARVSDGAGTVMTAIGIGTDGVRVTHVGASSTLVNIWTVVEDILME